MTRPSPARNLRRALLPPALLALVALPLLPVPPVAAQDPDAVALATSLRERRVTPAEIAAGLAERYRLDASGIAAVFRTARFGAAAAAEGLARGLRMSPDRVAGALLRAGYGDAAVLSALGDALSLDPTRAVGHMRAARVDAPRAVAALERGLGLDAGAAARVMKGGGYELAELAPALAGSGGRSVDQVAGALAEAEFPTRLVRLTLIEASMFDPVAFAAHMREEGESALDAAELMIQGFGTGPAEGAAALLAAGYRASDVARALRLRWEIDVYAARQALEGLDLGPGTYGPWSALRLGGYDIPYPEIFDYWIEDYRPGREGERIENLGVVHRASLLNADDRAGTVWIVSDAGLENPQAEMGDLTVDLVSRAPHPSSSSRPLEAYEFHFPRATGGRLVIRHGELRSSEPARPMGYYLVTQADIQGLLDELEIVVGDPVGEATVRGIGETSTVPIESFEELGTVADVVDLASTGATFEIESSGGGTVDIRIRIAFEENGAEIEGAMPSGLPFEGDLEDPSLELTLRLVPSGDGGVAVAQTLADFDADITLRSMAGSVPIGPLQSWILTTVGSRITNELAAMDPGQGFVDLIAAARGINGNPTVEALYRTLGAPNLFIDWIW